MALRDILLSFVKNIFIEGPASKTGFAALIKDLKVNGQTISTRLGGIASNAANRSRLRHIIGIERWGQSRMRTLSGQTLVLVIDEYDGYQPAESLDWNDLREQFASTRIETIATARQLVKAGVNETATANHNSFGPMSLGAWLKYLGDHAARESRLIR